MSAAPIAVCIGTFGSIERWSTLAHERAIASVRRQTLPAHSIHWCHHQSLQHARNGAAASVSAEWLCFLDADDELDDSYLEEMTATIERCRGPALIQPATLGVHPDGREDPAPVVIPQRPLLDGNYMVIGTLVHREQFERLQGFNDLPIYEDWDLFIRAWLDGADLLCNPNAIYRVHVNDAGRNNACRDQQVAVYNKIRNQYLGSTRRGS